MWRFSTFLLYVRCANLSDFGQNMFQALSNCLSKWITWIISKSNYKIAKNTFCFGFPVNVLKDWESKERAYSFMVTFSKITVWVVILLACIEFMTWVPLSAGILSRRFYLKILLKNTYFLGLNKKMISSGVLTLKNFWQPTNVESQSGTHVTTYLENQLLGCITKQDFLR